MRSYARPPAPPKPVRNTEVVDLHRACSVSRGSPACALTVTTNEQVKHVATMMANARQSSLRSVESARTQFINNQERYQRAVCNRLAESASSNK